MRLHPAVACTMLVAGAFPLSVPVMAWAYVAAERGSLSDTDLPTHVVPAEVFGMLTGLELFVVGVLFSLAPRGTGDRPG